MKCEMSLKHYFELLSILKGQGYTFHSFRENPNSKKKMIWLRHDIDVSPETALKMAYIEQELGIKATYFIRYHSDFYNPFSHFCNKILNELLKIAWLGEHLEKKEKPTFKIISFHCPNKSLLNKKIKGRISTYEPKFYSKIQYISDSKKIWHCPCRRLRKLSNNIQILTHPIWWTSK